MCRAKRGECARVRSVIEDGVLCQQQQPAAQMTREAVKGVVFARKRKTDIVGSLNEKRREESGVGGKGRHGKAHALLRGRSLEKSRM